MTTIANTSDVQTTGSLLGDAGGGPKSDQLDEALLRGQREMLGFFTVADYEAVRDYAGVDADELKKKEDFKRGESLFALAHLPDVIRSAQLTEKGFITESEIGKAITRYGDPATSDTYEDSQRVQAMLTLADYLDLEMKDENDEVVGITTGDGKLSIMIL